MRHSRILVILMAATMGATACGDDTSKQDAASPETVTVEKTVPEKASEPKKAQGQKSPAKQGSAGRKIKVPDVVGKDHQLAQDTMQEAGLFSLQEEDATGQGRALLYDRNWTTVSQDPPAGSLVSEDQTITLKAKKDGE